jgi:hypothetical protein
MDIRRFTFWLGVVLLALGVLGFVRPLLDPPLVTDPTLSVTMNYGRLFSLLPVNILHNLVRLALGLWAIVAAKDYISSRIFCRAIAIIYVVLAVMGLFPVLNTTFGLMPVHGGNILLSALIAVASGYYGYIWTNQYRSKSDTKATVR